MGVATRNNHKFYEIVVLISLCLSCAYCIVVVEKSWTHSYINIWNKYKYFFVVGFWREIQITKNIVGPRDLQMFLWFALKPSKDVLRIY